MRHIDLTQGRRAIVDDADYERLNRFRWRVFPKDNGNCYAIRSRFKGVHWCKHAKRWVVKIRKGGKKVHVGHFTVEKDAALAYDRNARAVFGEFAYLNFPTRENDFTSVGETYPLFGGELCL